MKKTYVSVLATVLLVTGCSSGEIDQKGANVFPSSTMEDSISITMGDVMPFYDDGVMNIYHLRNVTGSNSLFYHPIARLTTSDYIHYTDEGVSLNYEESVSSVDAALGTGSFIKDSNGHYHCFYTGHNDKAHDEGLPHNECIRHAVSVDGQKTWTKDEEFKIYGYEDDFRDPYVYYDNVDNCYYMLVTTRDYANKDEEGNALSPAVIRRFFASSLSAKADEWEFKDNFFSNDEGTYNMECPSFVEYNGKYYLAYSEQGDNRVTHYRYKDSHDGVWKKFARDAIDASGFYAGRIEKAGDKLYAFAWCARLTGGNTGSFDWAGNLVTHELKQNSNGELIPVMPSTYKDYFKNQVQYARDEKTSAYEFSKENFNAYAQSKLSKRVTRVSFVIKATEKTGNFGVSFGLDALYDNRLGDGLLSFDFTNDRLSCYNNVSNILRYGGELTGVSYKFEVNKEYNVDMVIDDEIFSVYLNDEIALTARLINMEGNNFTFYGNHANATISGVTFYE
ncbi:MAG: DUF4975 domain-containing protein [Bacilli bacterium]|nr:DUF4975 domain-containing protein [Bacilli bacterium]